MSLGTSPSLRISSGCGATLSGSSVSNNFLLLSPLLLYHHSQSVTHDHFTSEYEFVLTDIQFKIIDVGGEREERVRWIDFLAVSLYFLLIKGEGGGDVSYFRFHSLMFYTKKT